MAKAAPTSAAPAGAPAVADKAAAAAAGDKAPAPAPGPAPAPERKHLQQTIEEQEDALLNGMALLADEPAAGDEERLAARIGALVAQRRRIVALCRAGAVDEAVTAALLTELDDRVALLGERLVDRGLRGGRAE